MRSPAVVWLLPTRGARWETDMLWIAVSQLWRVSRPRWFARLSARLEHFADVDAVAVGIGENETAQTVRKAISENGRENVTARLRPYRQVENSFSRVNRLQKEWRNIFSKLKC